MDVELIAAFSTGLVVAGGLLAKVAKKTVRGRLDLCIDELIAATRSDASPYRGSSAGLVLDQAAKEALCLRFYFAGQRGLLEFALQQFMPRPFASFDPLEQASTRLRFWIRPTQRARWGENEPFPGPFSAAAREHLWKLDRLASVCVETTDEGLYVMTTRLLSTKSSLLSFVEQTCALVALHNEGRLFG